MALLDSISVGQEGLVDPCCFQQATISQRHLDLAVHSAQLYGWVVSSTATAQAAVAVRYSTSLRGESHHKQHIRCITTCALRMAETLPELAVQRASRQGTRFKWCNE